MRADRDRLVHAAQTRMEQASIRNRLEKELVVLPSPAAAANHEDDNDEHGAAESARVEQILQDELEKLGAPWEEELRASKARQEDLLDQIAVSLCAFLLLSFSDLFASSLSFPHHSCLST